MATITLKIGIQQVLCTGQLQDDIQKVTFEGEKLNSITNYYGSDTRGVDQILYRADDGRLVVHTCDWSNWQGETTTYTLEQVTEEDLGPNGPYGQLGQGTELSRPLTLDEALRT